MDYFSQIQKLITLTSGPNGGLVVLCLVALLLGWLVWYFIKSNQKNQDNYVASLNSIIKMAEDTNKAFRQELEHCHETMSRVQEDKHLVMTRMAEIESNIMQMLVNVQR